MCEMPARQREQGGGTAKPAGTRGQMVLGGASVEWVGSRWTHTSVLTWLCDPGPVTAPRWASVATSVKWG